MADLNIGHEDALLKQAEQRIDPFYSATNQARLIEARERMEKTGGTVHNLFEESREDESPQNLNMV